MSAAPRVRPGGCPSRGPSDTSGGLLASPASPLPVVTAVAVAVLILAPAPAAADDLEVRVVSPTPDDIVVGEVRVRAEVGADRPEAVTAVDFVVDGRLLFTDAEPPYELLWDAGSPAAHRIEVTAYGSGRRRARDVVETAAAPPGSEAAVSYAARVDRVQLYARVEGAGELDRELVRTDFRVLESGRQQEIVEVQRVSDLPIAVGLLVDCSGSMIDRLEPAIDAAESFVEGLLSLEDDKIYTMSFADLPIVLQDFTNDVDRLTTSLDLVRPGNDTRLYDSIIGAVDRFQGVEGRRALVVLTDGHDEGSDATLSEAIAAAQRAGVALYPVGVELSHRYFRERWILHRLAARTGGRDVYLYHPDEAERLYRQIAEDLREQYRITYHPSTDLGDGGWREVEVRVVGLDDVDEVRTRPGYFAE